MQNAKRSAKELLDLQKTLYTSENPTRRCLHSTRREWIIGAILRHLPKDRSRAIEIGPGSGIYLPVLAERFSEVVASDVEFAFLSAAHAMTASHPNISVVEDDITASTLPSAAFNLVLCTEVIEHIANSLEALNNIHRILKPQGVLVLSTPQRYSLLELTSKIAFMPGVIQIVRWIYNEPIIETGHINLLTARRAGEQLRQAGFVVKERFVSGLYLPLVAEFLGNAGLAFERACEDLLKRLGILGILWTQYYVAERASDDFGP